MATTSVEVTSWARYNVSRLSIAPSLAGAFHVFAFASKRVEVRLPEKPLRPRGSNDAWGNDKISCTGWRAKSRRPLCYHIASVDVLVGLKTRATIPSEALNRVDVGLFRSRQRQRLDELATVGESVATQALDWWIRTLRWKTLNFEIGQPEIIGRESGWTTYLQDTLTRRPFYGATQTFRVPADNAVSKRAWRATCHSLNRGITPPAWFDFLFEGEHRIASGDRHGGVISLAIACETLFRALFALHGKQPSSDEFVSLLNQLPISRIVDRWKQLGFGTKTWQRAVDLKQIKRLFELRNRIIHRATVNLDEAECEHLRTVVRDFICFGAIRLNV